MVKWWITGLLVVVVGLGLFAIQLHGVGTVPPLGATLDPTTGAYTIAKGAALPTNSTFTPLGAPGSASIAFSPQGIAQVHASSDATLWYSIGYLEGRERLFEMDLLRRYASGSLSAVLGQSYLSTDEFELRLNLIGAARRNYEALSTADKHVLAVFSQGVNAARSYEIKTHTLAATFRLLDYTPAPWTPVDSMLIQEYLTQDLNYTQNPVDYTILADHLGFKTTMDLFPEYAANTQSPYDTGPYSHGGISPKDPPTHISKTLEAAAQSISKLTASLRISPLHTFGNSNNWAVAGSRTTTGEAMMEGDPHLTQTLPAIWYWLTAKAPGLDFAGVAVPGLPIILIGRNANISWSLTDVESQATYFYHETTSPSHPGDYLFDGKWLPFRYHTYSIKVKGEPNHRLVVPVTVDGPVITTHGQTVVDDWLGARVSKDLTALLGVIQASNWSQFHAALSLWKAPAMNFIYASRHDSIGLISAGEYPVFKSGDPWMIMNGDGSEQAVGSIPYADVPESHNPSSGYVFSANQRPVTAAYPYYLGTSYDFFSTGFRADTIAKYLKAHPHMSLTDMEHLENSVSDYLATQLVPWLVAQFAGTHPSPQVSKAVSLLAHWNDSMTAKSPAASIWWTFLGDDLSNTFGPLFESHHVPQPKGSALDISQLNTPLVEDIENMDLNEPHSKYFDLPNGTVRSAGTVARLALTQTVDHLATELGPNPDTWHWDRIHFRHFASLTGVEALGYGPRGSSGDDWTVNAADGDLVSTAGPSWRMIIAYGDKGVAIYPGGQSENPLSPWYENQIPLWWTGKYLSFGLRIPSTIATWRINK